MELGALRRKLTALEYPDADKLEAGSAELVQQLLGDLLRVTEGFRAQRRDLVAAHQQVDDFHTQVCCCSCVWPTTTPLHQPGGHLRARPRAGSGICSQAGRGSADIRELCTASTAVDQHRAGLPGSARTQCWQQTVSGAAPGSSLQTPSGAGECCQPSAGSWTAQKQTAAPW